MRRRAWAYLSVLLCLMLIVPTGIYAQDDEGAETTAEVTETTLPETTPAAPAATPTIEGIEYYVLPGDNLFRIATRFGVTIQDISVANGITNPALIYVGQRLIIPVASPQPTTTPTATTQPTSQPTETPEPTESPEVTEAPTVTEEPPATIDYVVRSGDTLFSIAVRNGTTVSRILAVNPDITNPNVVYVGRIIKIPAPGTQPQPTSRPDTPATPVDVAELENAEFGSGIEIFPVGQDMNVIISQLSQLDVTWVKLTLDWRDLEPVQGELNLDTLNTVINALDEAGYEILVNLTGAPDWARPEADPAVNAVQTGPPANLEDFGTFAGRIATQYAGIIDAYEIWKQPNIRTWWRAETGSARMSDVKYTDLLRVAYNAIKTADPQAFVITAGLAPTEFNDRINAINDRVFVQGLYDNGVEGIADAIGAAPEGFANPPDNRAPTRSDGVESHYERGVFFFLDTLSDYRTIMLRNEDSDRSIWITQFGWGTTEGGIIQPPDQTMVYLTYNSLEEQAIYISRAFELAEELGYVGPMMLYNLNGCSAGLTNACYYSLIDANRTARPAFAALTRPTAPDAAGDAETTEEAPAAEETTVPETTETPDNG